ncbi:MAG: M23 family metallopeptidase [Campylobacter sp.]
MRRGNLNFVIYTLVLLIFVVLLYLIFSSKMFEKEPPKIAIDNEIYWNLKTPFPINITDDSGIKSVKIVLNDGQRKIDLLNQRYDDEPQNLDLNLTFPKLALVAQKLDYFVNIEVVDTSKWGFFAGNSTSKNVRIIVDNKAPDVYILNNSYAITRGGSATVVFKATDERLKYVYIESNFGKNFIPAKFYKDGYFASLVAWPATKDLFSADVVAIDYAGNISRSKIRFFYQNKNYKTSTIKLDNQNRFLNEKIPELATKFALNSDDMSNLEKMKFVNETLRQNNEKLISQIASKISMDMITDFRVDKFYPLRNGKAVASFGDHRFYTFENKDVSESWHMGIDLASTQRANIVASNGGVVAFADDNGIYGNNVLINHGFGLFSLYGHCTDLAVKVGDFIKAGDIIGTTGVSGLALGDHLHFGMLVQGIEVRPEEWMDNGWMKDNVVGVLQVAKKMIDAK